MAKQPHPVPEGSASWRTLRVNILSKTVSWTVMMLYVSLREGKEYRQGVGAMLVTSRVGETL